MLAKLHVTSLMAASGLVLATCMSGPANAADPFTLTSATFKDGTLMPKKVRRWLNLGIDASRLLAGFQAPLPRAPLELIVNNPQTGRSR
jgi:hypothetical protein